MQEQFEQTSTAEMQSITHWDEVHNEVYSDYSSLLPTAFPKDHLNFDAIRLHFKSAYEAIRTNADCFGSLTYGKGIAQGLSTLKYEAPITITTMQYINNKSNEQSPESRERDSSRLNREEDRQPYMDSTSHQETSEPTNEQSAELPEGFSTRINREDDRQPYLDRERHQDANGTAL